MSKIAKTSLYYVVAAIGLLSCVVFGLYLHQVDESAKQVVETYWSLCLENKIEKANELTSFGGKGSAWTTKEKIPSTQTSRADGKNDCCFQDVIFQNKIKLDKITDVKVFRDNVGEEDRLTDKNGKEFIYKIEPTIGITVATTDDKEQKTELAVCLGKSVFDNQWKVRKVTFLANKNLKSICSM